VNNITEVQLFKDDFRVILLSLMECQTAWRTMIDEGELPDVPNMDMGRAQHILVRFSEVKDKIQTILDGEPLNVDGESVKKILDIIKENGKLEKETMSEDKCDKCDSGTIQHTSFMNDDGVSITHVYGCNRCDNGWSKMENPPQTVQKELHEDEKP
jgi:hypothetical protein